MVGVQVRDEDDVDVGRLDASFRQLAEQLAATVVTKRDGAEPGIDEDAAVARPHDEATEWEGELALVVRPAGVVLPLARRRFREVVHRREAHLTVGHGDDLQVADLELVRHERTSLKT